MTNKQYLTKSLNGLNLSDDDIDIIILKGGLQADGELDMTACDKAVYKRFSTILKGCMQNITEGGYSVTYNMEAVKMYYNSLCNELGLENVLNARPKLRNRSNMW